YVIGFDLLAEIFRRSAHHEPGDEDSEYHKDENTIKTSSDSAEDHFTQHDVDKRHHSAERRERIVHTIHRTAAGVRCHGGEQGRVRDAEADFLALHVAASLHFTSPLVGTRK